MIRELLAERTAPRGGSLTGAAGRAHQIGGGPATAGSPCTAGVSPGEGGPIVWAGSGRVAFAGGCGTGSPPEEGARAYLAAGGARCLILDDERLARPGSSWIGDDGGPGYRTGLHALVERDDVGTVVLPGPVSPPALDAVADLAGRWPQCLFVCVRDRGPAPRDLEVGCAFPEENLVVAGPRAASTPEGLGRLLAYLEAVDFREEPPFLTPSASLPPGFAPEDVLRLRALRRRQGLLRSIDLGSRWTLFELNRPVLRRAIERDISAFLWRLADAGFLARERGRPTFEVACEPLGAGPEVGGPWAPGDGVPRERALTIDGAGGRRGVPAVREGGSAPSGVHIALRVQLSEPFGSAFAGRAAVDRRRTGTLAVGTGPPENEVS